MQGFLGEAQLEQGGELYYSEEYLKEALSAGVRSITLGDLEEEEFDRFCSLFNEFGLYDHINVYINSGGGAVFLRDRFIHLFESYPNLTLIANGTVGSAAFHLFIMASNQKIIQESCSPIFHVIRFNMIKAEDGTALDEEGEYFLNVKLKQLQRFTDSFMELCEFSAEEKKTVKDKKDLFITPERLNEMNQSYWANITE